MRPKEPDFGYTGAEFQTRKHWGRECVYVWTGENATSGPDFFKKRRKKVAFSNEYGYVWTGLLLLVMSTMPVLSSNF